MGVGEASRDERRHRRRDRGALDDHRPAAEHPPRPQVDRRLQAPRGHAGRRLGDAAQGADVGVRRPPRLDLDPADPRLPRPQPARLRRSRQLLARHPRAAHLPRDRLRLDQGDPRPRHRLRDHRADRRGGLRAAARARLPVRAGGPSRRQQPPRSSPPRRRSSARRRRGCAPRPSRPPSSSSRKRTPRLTRSPSPTTKRAKRATANQTSDRRGRGVMAKTSQRVKQAEGLEVQGPQLQPLPQVRPLPRRLPQVRPLPDLPARGRSQGLRPRHDEVELVGATDAHRPHRRLPDPGAQRAARRPSRGRDPRFAPEEGDDADPRRAGLPERLRGRADAPSASRSGSSSSTPRTAIP